MTASQPATEIRLERYGPDDFDVLVRHNSPEMTDHLGGPESDDALRRRHDRYVAMTDPAAGEMYRVALVPDDVTAGMVGYWEREWLGETVYEIGWGVQPEFQGRGIAAAAARAVVARIGQQGRHRAIHAFPSVDHVASNAVCRKAGLELLGPRDFEYPAGNPIRCNDWRVVV